MTIRDCLARAVRDGGMDPARARRVLADYEQTLEGLRGTLAPSAAEAEAARQILRLARIDAIERRRTIGLTAEAAGRLKERLVSDRRGPGGALKDLVSSPAGARGVTIDGQYEAVRRELRRGLSRFIAKHRATLIGTRRKRGQLDNVVDEIFGAKSGDPEARVFAQAWRDAAETARLRFNAAGGRIPSRADWGMPQSHDPRAISKAQFEPWREFIAKRLDLERMVDESTGLPFTRESMEVRLREAYDAILSDGWSRREASGVSAGRAAHNRRLDHRFFVFKDATAWREYQARFGNGDAFRVMVGHLDHMAREIAEMEVLGPSPNVMFEWLKQNVQQMEARAAGPAGIERAAADTQTAQNMLDVYRGATQRAGNRSFARAMSATRQYLTSAVLGQAVITSITDFNSARVAAEMVGMHSLGPMRQMARLIASPELRVQAAEAGLIFENAVNLGHAAGRFQMEDLHIESAARMADFTIRASGLGYLTEIQRHSFGLEFMVASAKNTSRDWGALDKGYRGALERYGLSPEDWAKIRRAKHYDGAGMAMLRAEEIADSAGQNVADRYMEMIASLTEFAVPTTSIRGKAAILGTTRPGTVPGEFMRSFFQFKAFPVTIMVNQGRLAVELNRQFGVGNALGFAANFFVGMTVMGAISLQLKEIGKGRDPRAMDTWKFWAAAAAQGGGAGLFGDFFFADQNRFGMNPWEQAGGPTLSLMADVAKLTVGNVQQLATGEDTAFGNDMLRFARRYTPGGSLWQARLVYEREILDQIQKIVDPKASQRFRARERAAREFDTKFFWRPGRSVLRGDRVRAPSLAGIRGDR